MTNFVLMMSQPCIINIGQHESSAYQQRRGLAVGAVHIEYDVDQAEDNTEDDVKRHARPAAWLSAAGPSPHAVTADI